MMKYQKAVQKAKLARGEASVPMPDAALDTIVLSEGPLPEAVPIAKPARRLDSAAGIRAKVKNATAPDEWKPPVYTHTRKVTPDAAVAARNRLICLKQDAPEQEYYKVLRTQLMQRMKPNGWNMLMITSVFPGEGKSLTSINLAAAVAKVHNQTVLLVDCDLRRQSIWRYMGLTGDKGMVDYLADGRELKDLLVWPEIEKMTLISGGPEVADSAELLGSPRMRTLMTEMKGRYEDRLIILDAPPILSGADVMVMAPYLDGIVVVVESGKTPLKDIKSAMDRIPKEKFLGFVLNKHADVVNEYHKRYDKRRQAVA